MVGSAFALSMLTGGHRTSNYFDRLLVRLDRCAGTTFLQLSDTCSDIHVNDFSFNADSVWQNCCVQTIFENLIWLRHFHNGVLS